MPTIASNTVLFATLIVVMIGEDGVLYSNGGVKVVRGWARGEATKWRRNKRKSRIRSRSRSRSRGRS